MKIVYRNIIDDRDLVEANWRGVISNIAVHLGDIVYEVRVLNYERLKIEIDLQVESSSIFLLDPGTIVIKDEITVENVEFAIGRLVDAGYFNLLLPETPSA